MTENSARLKFNLNGGGWTDGAPGNVGIYGGRGVIIVPFSVMTSVQLGTAMFVTVMTSVQGVGRMTAERERSRRTDEERQKNGWSRR